MKKLITYLILALGTGLVSITINAQSTGTGNAFLTNYYLGYTTNNDLNFGFGIAPITPLMTLKPSGNFGIGTTSPTTNMLLDVNGNTNIHDALFGYHINGNELLKYHGNTAYTPSTTNIFVGLGAGLVNKSDLSLVTGIKNTFVGNEAGVSNTDGSYNTFIGYRSGQKNLLGRFNTLVGDSAGASILCKYYNTFVGYHAGVLAGNDNGPGEYGGTFVGNLSGGNTLLGDGNSFFGDHAGFNNVEGAWNTYIGALSMADYTNNSSDNMFSTALGAHTKIKGSHATTLGAYSMVEGNRSTALGQHAGAKFDDIIIIGNNSVSVGIGLSSSDAMLIAPPSTNANTKLEINAIIGTSFANIDEFPGASGLRFRDLTINSTPVLTNPNTNVLSVNEDGDVILVPNAGNFGNACTGTDWDIPANNNWRVGLNHQTLYFQGQSVGVKDNVAIGFNCIENVGAKLNVIQRKPWALNNGVGDASWAGAFFSFPDVKTNLSVGVLGWADTNTNLGIGIWGMADATINNVAVHNWAIGVYGESRPHGLALWGTNRLWAGMFNGALCYVTQCAISDSTLKRDINPIVKSLSLIDSLNPKSFYFDSTLTNAKGLYVPSVKQYGFIAQEVEKILPELVTEGVKPPQYDKIGNLIHPEFTFKTLNYNAFIGILTQGIKDLDSISDNHASRLDTIEAKGRGDYDWLLAGSNAQARTPGDIEEIKYTNGYLQLNHNSTTPSAVFDVRNDTSIAHFNNRGAGLFNTDATGFNLSNWTTFNNLECDIYNMPNIQAQFVGLNSHLTSEAMNFDNVAIYGQIDGFSLVNSGVRGFAKDGESNVGVWGEAQSLNDGYSATGLYGLASGAGANGTSSNMAVYGEASGGGYNYGGLFTAGGNGSTYYNFGVFTCGYGAPTNYGIMAEAGGGTTNFAGYFNGDVNCTGTYYNVSDQMLKNNVQPLSNTTNATNIINQLNPVTYTFKTTDYPQMSLSTLPQIGFVAQDVEAVVPNLVKEIVHPAKFDSAGHQISPAVSYKGLNYQGIIPVLVQAVKESNHKTDSLTHSFTNKIDSMKQIINHYETRFNQLEQMINACCLSHTNKSMENPNGEQTTEIDLKNIQSIVLDQNVPNPFAESTVINYFIPENIKFAQMIFTDNFGRIMKTVDITASGNGVIKVYASNLSSGIYTYSLVVDGKVVDSKKMVCTNK